MNSPGRVITFVNAAHFIDHYAMLIFAAAVIIIVLWLLFFAALWHHY